MNISAKKSLGQNFLQDKNIIHKIIRAISPKEGEHILEIGPGQGALTEELLKSGANIHVLEKDERMKEPLEKLQKKHPETLHITFGDAMKENYPNLVSSHPFKMVGNLPYNVGTQIVIRALATPGVFTSLTFMLQREVVDRITATPNTSDWGRLAVWCDLLCERKRLFDVPPSAFHPKPKVTSAIVQLPPLPKPRFQVERKKLEHILNKSFTQRRKMLRSSLKGVISEEQMENLGIQPTRRPETLSTEEFCKLANLL